MKRIQWTIAGLVLLCGCVKHDREAPGMVLYSHPEVDAKSPCAAIGGYWFRSRSGDFLCDEPAVDAGKTCSDSHDCEGTCIAPATTPANATAIGHCDRFHIVAGRCVNEVRGGRALGVSCVD